MTSRKKYEIHAEEINNRRNSAPKWTQRNWFTRIYIHYSRASNLIVVEHPELASLFTINKRIYRSRFTKISSHGYTLLRWDESRQYSRVGGGTPETRVGFLYCSRMCRTSTVFITVCAPFSKRRILLREPPTPQDDDSLVHRPPPPGQGASRRRLRLYIYIRVQLPSAWATKRKEIAAKVTPRTHPLADLLLTLRFCVVHDAPLYRRIPSISGTGYRHVAEMLGWSNRIWIWGFFRVAGLLVSIVSLFFSFSPSFRLFLISGRLFVLGNFRIRVERIRYYIRGWKSIILRKIGEFFKSIDFALKDFGDFVEYE